MTKNGGGVLSLNLLERGLGCAFEFEGPLVDFTDTKVANKILRTFCTLNNLLLNMDGWRAKPSLHDARDMLNHFPLHCSDFKKCGIHELMMQLA